MHNVKVHHSLVNSHFDLTYPLMLGNRTKMQDIGLSNTNNLITKFPSFELISIVSILFQISEIIWEFWL